MSPNTRRSRSKTKKVPSDLIPSVVHRRHARHWTLQTGAPNDSPLSSPVAALTATGLTLQDSSQLTPVWGRMLVAAFHSPATASALAENHSRVNVPGLLLRLPGLLFPLPVRSSTPLPGPVCPGSRPLLCIRPVADSTVRLADCSPGLRSPSGLSIPTVQCVQPGLLPASPPSVCARSPFAPRRRSSITSNCGCGSPFRVRYAFVGLLFLKPLGTFLNMPWKPFGVNAFLELIRAFPQIPFGLFRSSYNQPSVNCL